MYSDAAQGKDRRFVYLQFDFSSITEEVLSATLKLHPFEVSGTVLHDLFMVDDDTWVANGVIDDNVNPPPFGIVWNTRPDVGTQILPSWTPSQGQEVSIDLTTEVLAAVADVNDGKLSLRISTQEDDIDVKYGSIENTDSNLHPVLELEVPASGSPGTGWYTVKQHLTSHTEQFPNSLASGDFDNDGDIDFATANNTSDDVSIILNNNGLFERSTPVVVDDGSWLIEAGYFDNDANLDLVVGNLTGFLNILLGDGLGGFTKVATNVSLGDKIHAMAIGDFDLDGLDDIVTTSDPIYPKDIQFWMSNGDGTFTLGQDWDFGSGDSMANVTVGDLNNDGKPDVILQDVLGPGDYLIAYLGNGDGTFGVGQPTSSIGMNGGDIALADFDGDGYQDIIVTSDNSVKVIKGNGDATFDTANLFTLNTDLQPESLTGLDFDSDGDVDLAVINHGGPEYFTGTVSLFENMGGAFPDGTNPQAIFTEPIRWITEVGITALDGAAEDLDGDGDIDLAVLTRHNNTVTILENDEKPIIPNPLPCC